MTGGCTAEPEPAEHDSVVRAAAADEPDLTYANRLRSSFDGLPDWSRVGYLAGQPLPTDDEINGDAACRITPAQLAAEFHVIADDGADDTTGLQDAIDRIKDRCSPSANPYRLSLITLPAGRIDLSRQIYVDASFLLLRGQRAGAGGAKGVVRPDSDTRYDTLSHDQSRWDPDSMTFGTGRDLSSGGWIWPGRAMFKVQTRDVAARYNDIYRTAPANRKDLYEGTINQHWASGLKLSDAPGDPGFSAREGQRVIHVAANVDMKKFTLGGYVWVGAANSVKFYERQGLNFQEHVTQMEDLHMRQQVFGVVAIDGAAKTITLDGPLEFDVPVDSMSDGSLGIRNPEPNPSKVTPLKVVEGVGFENFSYGQELNGMPKLVGGTYSVSPQDAVQNYGNIAPEYAMHGIEFKWAVNCWARGLDASMTGSHPVVTEVARNIQIERNHFDGAWNKGKGGNGYLRGSRVWHSLYAYNVSRNLRHFTFQWSASNNVAFRNDLDSDLNLHGGWERRNLFEGNTVQVPFEHRSGNCTANCGGEGGDDEDGTWYPIWWAAGRKAIKWSGSSGPQNVFYHNTLTKQLTPGGPFIPYQPYTLDSPGVESDTIFEFGSDSSNPRSFRHLSQGGALIPDWNHNETLDYAGEGIVALTGRRRPSLFLRHVGELDPRVAGMRTVMTWNMQGAGTTGGGSYENKYGQVLTQMQRAGIDIVALQEAGSRPQSALHVTNHGQDWYFNRNGVNPPVEEYTYGGTMTSPLGFLYWLHSDTSDDEPNRVNMAIFSRVRATGEPIVIPNPLTQFGRPAMGLIIEGTAYFTLHGFSGSGNDMAPMIRQIRARMQADHPGMDWFAMGDFNRDSGEEAVLLGPQFHVAHTPTPTHPTRNPVSHIDYLVHPTGINVPRVFSEQVMDNILYSDHLPVRYVLDGLQAAAEPPQLVDHPEPPRHSLLRNAATTNVADLARDGTNRILNRPYRSGFMQQWGLIPDPLRPDFYRLMNLLDGNYMGQEGSARNARVVQWPDRNDDQLWRPDYQDDGTWTLTNAVPGQLLTALSDLEGTLAGRDWDGSSRQRWFFESEAAMERSSQIAQFPPQSATDLVVDVDHGNTGENTSVILFPDQNAANESFSVIPGQRNNDRPCYYLVYGGKYLNTWSSGGPVPPGAPVHLNSFRPNEDSYLWCEGSGSESVTLSNRTLINGFAQDLYLTPHGPGRPLTVELSTGLTPTWRWVQ